MKWPSSRGQSGGCNLGHGVGLTAATGEMWSAAVFNLAHKFRCLLIQFYCPGTRLFKQPCLLTLERTSIVVKFLCRWPEHIPLHAVQSTRA